MYGKNEYPLCTSGRSAGASTVFIDRCFFHFSDKSASSSEKPPYNDGEIVCLIKPQFEAGREKVGKKGVVREKSTHIEVIHKVIDYAMSIGFEVLNLEFSPIKGPEGNIEYLVHLQKCEATDRISPEIDVEKTVDQSFATLAKG